MTKLLPSQGWPELVFHVLAHLQDTAQLPASAYDGSYCAFVERHVGEARGRPLGEDAAVLERHIDGHVSLAQLQLLAWLFDTTEQALASADRELAELSAVDVARPGLLPVLAQAEPMVELLRCAALLEAEVVAALPAMTARAGEVGAMLTDVAPAAPYLTRLDWRPVRPLGWRGRVAFGEIWTGAPAIMSLWQGAPPAAHVAWQAAHEATVVEVGEHPAAEDLAERSVEALSVLLLSQRAHGCGLQQGHMQWLAALHFSVADAVRQGPTAAQQRVLDQFGAAV